MNITGIILFIVSVTFFIIGICLNGRYSKNTKWLCDSICSTLDCYTDCIGECGSEKCMGRLHYGAIKQRGDVAFYKKELEEATKKLKETP
jgi:hypothetical protein